MLIWKDGRGERIPLEELTDAHLDNIIRYMERKCRVLDGKQNYRRAILKQLLEEQELRKPRRAETGKNE